MTQPKINSATQCFLGMFQYEVEMKENRSTLEKFENLDIYLNSKAYFNQKYYSNWLTSFLETDDQTHLKLKKTDSLFTKEFVIKGAEDSDLIFSINEVQIFFFNHKMAVFVIKTQLPKQHLNWADLSKFGATFRRTALNSTLQKIPLAVEIIEQHITSQFHSNPIKWRTYNPMLKACSYVDIDKEVDPESMDSLLYQLGTFSPFQKDNNLFSPSEEYLQKQIKENSISIFKNWKTLCLHDSITRIAVNLDEEDQYKLWENEYILIYIYTLYMRYYLNHINDDLIVSTKNMKQVKNKRDRFFNFINTYNHSKISYKFLPNEIFDKFKKVLGVEAEIQLIEEKLSRGNLLRQEQYENRVNKILLALTLLTLISVGYDGGEMFSKFEWSQSLVISLSLISVTGGVIIYLFYSKK